MLKNGLLLITLCYSLSLQATTMLEFSSESQEALYRKLTGQLRCTVCQNQSISESMAPMAEDLREKVFHLVTENKQEAEILDYLRQRYGDFVSYEPPVRPNTWLLWVFPLVALLIGVGMWMQMINWKPNQ